jgi:hypothetical protein
LPRDDLEPSRIFRRQRQRLRRLARRKDLNGRRNRQEQLLKGGMQFLPRADGRNAVGAVDGEAVPVD